MIAPLKKYVIWIMLAITFLLSAYVKKKDVDTTLVETTHFSKINAMSVNRSTSDETYNLDRELSEPKVDIFQTQAKVTQPTVPPKIIPPIITQPSRPIEVAQQNPGPLFRYLGKYFDQDGLVVFLNLNGKNFIVKEGETIQQLYRVDEIKPPTMTITYLPINNQQIINIGDMN